LRLSQHTHDEHLSIQLITYIHVILAASRSLERVEERGVVESVGPEENVPTGRHDKDRRLSA
jgi:hypothetical protein